MIARLPTVHIVIGPFMILMLSGCSISVARPADAVISYEDVTRTGYERFSSSFANVGETAPKRKLPFQSVNPLFGEEVGRVLHDCSTAQFLCVYYWARVFAVPKGRLSPNTTYSVAGASLTVEDCLRGDTDICQVALISSDCQERSGLDSCVPATGGREKSRQPGPITYFIFNEDIGVTAWGVTKQVAKSKDERLAIAGQMILQGERGLLFSDGGR